ncbi:hypothetical protein OB905_02315 [Halobacteria archaeon AArc-dxtr1]|nr:hypothetical protein [Halobacteria archaeon AArc-dxtr1]
MKSLEVTDEQYALVQHLREAISEQVVGKYGHVRERDVIQFLLDNVGEDLDVELDVDDVPTGADAEGLAAVAYDESSTATESADPVESVDGADGDETDEREEPEAEAESSDAETSDADSEESSGSDEGAADDDDMLNEMMNLLDTHDDKWEESSSADYRYSVTLPDGTVEDVQTKDDVRALLFKNYR